MLMSQLCQLALRFASRPYVARSGSTLVFAPHPDDETLGCGALIARKRNGGHAVHVVFFTDGAASHPSHPRVTASEIAAIRAQEARRVLAILGVDSTAIHFLNEADGTLNRLNSASRVALVARTTALLDTLQPAEIFLPSHADGSSEHEAAFHFVAEAVARSQRDAAIWEYPVWLWWNPLTLLAQIVKTTGRYRVPTEDFLDVKRHALFRYRSQLAPLPPQSEPALPRDLLRLIDTEAEYFFHSTLLEARPSGSARPVI